eukprot:CAMPEP_0184698622 /NCGR_PEP_ID=MMETSP0313-20130426/5178_1 /TAXON_ID=2792 /ORGANISM="Porphyridium aerugineum, Strain SAG 1380-2" /LENGTH=785 /DNA_ID=CAMNT_0027157587 /DNA_START=65 /DNA_END=2422 /DNA_ORIENTATION=-
MAKPSTTTSAKSGSNPSASAISSSSSPSTTTPASASTGTRQPQQRQDETLAQQVFSVFTKLVFMYLLYSLVLSKDGPIYHYVAKAFTSQMPAGLIPISTTSNINGTNINASVPEMPDPQAMLQSFYDSYTGATAMKRNALPPDPILLKADYPVTNAWRSGQAFEFRIYLNTQENVSFEEVLQHNVKPDWFQQGLTYDWNEGNKNRNVVINFTLPDDVISKNTSYYMHAFLYAQGAIRDNQVLVPEEFRKDVILEFHHSLIKWRKRDLSKEGHKLLDKSAPDILARWRSKPKDAEGESNEPAPLKGEEACSLEEQGQGQGQCQSTLKSKRIVVEQVFKPEIGIALLVDFMMFQKKQYSQLPPIVQGRYSASNDGRHYRPPFFANEFWLLSERLVAVNATHQNVSLSLYYDPLSMMKLAMFAQMDSVWESQQDLGLIESGGTDEIKRMLLETNPYFLGLTMAVSLAHSVLEMLAFSSDIQHWRKTTSMQGISVQSMFWNLGMQAIVFFYLVDNDTSFMILVGQFVGLAIEVWKIGKAVKVKSFGKRKLLGFIPWIEWEDKDSYSSTTKEYDMQAMQYLSYVMYPLVILYSIYSLIYKTHKSWYSWVISSLVGAVYMFGFIMMFPQIFINYKLKSVAHLPMKAFMYKALNTIIDDLFSFIIKMPLMHRIACFRDDIVFVAFLYQRWIYPVDKTRRNEFGQVGEEASAAAATSTQTESVVSSLPAGASVVKKKKTKTTTESTGKKRKAAVNVTKPDSQDVKPSQEPSQEPSKMEEPSSSVSVEESKKDL